MQEKSCLVLIIMSLLITPAEVDLKRSEYPGLIHGWYQRTCYLIQPYPPGSGNHRVQRAPLSASSIQYMPLPGWCGFAHVWGTYWPGQFGVGASLATRSYKQNSCYSTQLSKPGRNNDIIFLFSPLKGVKAVCRSTKSYRSAPGGSGAGGSVVIITQSIVGNPNGKILVRGGSPTKCAWGVGGGTSKVPFCTKKVKLIALLFIT